MKRILIDCDPGHDDALAILLASGNPGVELVGITTVAGNQTLDKTTANALTVATVGNLGDVPIVAGHDRPLIRTLQTAAEFHGESGLDGPDSVVADRTVRPGMAEDFIVETLMSAPSEVSLVATGPLTNLAAALRREPTIADAAREVVIMGGTYGKGNVTQTAEFNIFVDPEAASVVFGAPWTVTMVGLDVTHRALCTSERQRRIAELGTPLAHFVDRSLGFYRRAYRRATELDDPPLHDPCAVAFVIAPELFETRPAGVDVEIAGRFTAGTTVVRFAGGSGTHPHRVPVDIDATAFFELLTDAIERAGRGAVGA